MTYKRRQDARHVRELTTPESEESSCSTALCGPLRVFAAERSSLQSVGRSRQHQITAPTSHSQSNRCSIGLARSMGNQLICSWRPDEGYRCRCLSGPPRAPYTEYAAARRSTDRGRAFTNNANNTREKVQRNGETDGRFRQWITRLAVAKSMTRVRSHRALNTRDDERKTTNIHTQFHCRFSRAERSAWTKQPQQKNKL